MLSLQWQSLPCNTSHPLMVFLMQNPRIARFVTLNHFCHSKGSLLPRDWVSKRRDSAAQGTEPVQKWNLPLPMHRGSAALLELCRSYNNSNNTHVPLLLDGFTHWSLTGTLVTDEDTFMGFNDGLSQSGNLEQGKSKEKGRGCHTARIYCGGLFIKYKAF